MFLICSYCNKIIDGSVKSTHILINCFFCASKYQKIHIKCFKTSFLYILGDKNCYNICEEFYIRCYRCFGFIPNILFLTNMIKYFEYTYKNECWSNKEVDKNNDCINQEHVYLQYNYGKSKQSNDSYERSSCRVNEEFRFVDIENEDFNEDYQCPILKNSNKSLINNIVGYKKLSKINLTTNLYLIKDRTLQSAIIYTIINAQIHEVIDNKDINKNSYKNIIASNNLIGLRNNLIILMDRFFNKYGIFLDTLCKSIKIIIPDKKILYDCFFNHNIFIIDGEIFSSKYTSSMKNPWHLIDTQKIFVKLSTELFTSNSFTDLFPYIRKMKLLLHNLKITCLSLHIENNRRFCFIDLYSVLELYNYSFLHDLSISVYFMADMFLFNILCDIPGLINLTLNFNNTITNTDFKSYIFYKKSRIFNDNYIEEKNKHNITEKIIKNTNTKNKARIRNKKINACKLEILILKNLDSLQFYNLLALLSNNGSNLLHIDYLNTLKLKISNFLVPITESFLPNLNLEKLNKLVLEITTNINVDVCDIFEYNQFAVFFFLNKLYKIRMLKVIFLEAHQVFNNYLRYIDKSMYDVTYQTIKELFLQYDDSLEIECILRYFEDIRIITFFIDQVDDENIDNLKDEIYRITYIFNRINEKRIRLKHLTELRIISSCGILLPLEDFISFIMLNKEVQSLYIERVYFLDAFNSKINNFPNVKYLDYVELAEVNFNNLYLITSSVKKINTVKMKIQFFFNKPKTADDEKPNLRITNIGTLMLICNNIDHISDKQIELLLKRLEYLFSFISINYCEFDDSNIRKMFNKKINKIKGESQNIHIIT